MGLISLGAYSGTMRIPDFKGLNQYGDGIGVDPRFAMELTGADTREGILRPMAECELLYPSLASPIETLVLLHRRWHVVDIERDVLIAASDGKLYWCLPDGNSWAEIAMPEGFTAPQYASNAWSCVSYEINPEDSDAPVDVLLMSNALDGMICVRGDNLTVTQVKTPRKFGVIARHAERIWGGAIEDEPDMLVYSAPYDPFNWEQDSEHPEDGAGDIQQPSWDGDSFEALAPFGSQLVALKKNRVWRILGTNPGEYDFKEQFGGGAPYSATVAVDGARMLMLGRNGIMRYDGESVSPYYQEYACDVFRRMNRKFLPGACAVMHGDIYYCALPLDNSQINNAVLMYNTAERTWLLREGIYVEDFLSTPDALYYTSATTPGKVWKWKDDGAVVPMRWVSGWQDFGYKNVTKSGFTIYLTVECKRPVDISFGIQTEKKLKTKTITFQPPVDGKGAKQRRLVFGGSGRRFRLIIESKGTEPWSLLGGIQLEAETDTD